MQRSAFQITGRRTGLVACATGRHHARAQRWQGTITAATASTLLCSRRAQWMGGISQRVQQAWSVGLVSGGISATALGGTASARCASSSSSQRPPVPPEYRRIAVEMGTGTSLRREDHTAAAVRALKDALWRISLTAYRALDKDPSEMRVEIAVGETVILLTSPLRPYRSTC